MTPISGLGGRFASGAAHYPTYTSRQSEEKPHAKLIHLIRRQVYETIAKEQVACPVLVRFRGPAAAGQEHNEWHDDAQTIQIEVCPGMHCFGI